ncbi:MFS transporter [Bradyrhizobium sp. Leo121]|uniref:MFS transporter n=1 Tax=Bradyrhizobium sp. Leo121 TaxID=1571195 RepID=UPI00102A0F1D|nr:MFS transporter [Bradyrhizobium sp. Leo121]RZN33746.1 MFS sugar transporter [Bradyrhizobium sp. Leo121]
MPAALYALATATFAIGMTEFVVVGLLPGIAADLGVSISAAGLLVSFYALSITLGTPVVSALTGALPRRGLAIGLMVIFTVCNLSAALAPNYSALLLSRIVMAVAHGVFFGVGAACATSLASKSRGGSAVAVMMGGLTVAMVIGVPIGSWIGQQFNWRTPFLVITALGTVAVFGLLWLLPREITYNQPAPFAAQLSLLGNRRLATMYLLTAVGFGSTFVVFTFLSPLLTEVTGVPEESVNIALLLFGAATVAGNLAGGKLSDFAGTRNAMMVLLCGLIVSFFLLLLAIHNEVATFAVIAIWGAFAFAIPPVMQAGVVATAREVAPDALGTASGFNIAAFNLGISGGSFIGGQLLEGPGLLMTPYASIAMAIIALLITTVALHRQPVTA